MSHASRVYRSLDPAPLLRAAAVGLDPMDNDRGQKHWGDSPSARLLAEAMGVTRETVNRWRTGTTRVRVLQADEICTRLGLHPIEVWGIRAWNDQVVEPDDREEFAE